MSTETENDLLTILREQHTATIQYGLDSINQDLFQTAADIICEAILRKANIFTIGNGASASIAQHWACDYLKGCSNISTHTYPKVISLAANIPLMTAISNDVDYQSVYSYQIERLGRYDDVLIAISSSGNSPNIVKAIETAQKMGIMVISLTGFQGGRCLELANVPLRVDVHEYEATEDCHQAIMHMIAKYIRMRTWNV